MLLQRICQVLLLVFLSSQITGAQAHCVVINSLDSALINLGVVTEPVEFYKVPVDDSTKWNMLDQKLTSLTGQSDMVSGLSPQEKIDLASMLNQLTNAQLADNKHGWGFNDLRAYFIEVMLQSRPELEPIAWLLSNQALVSAKCGEDIYYPEPLVNGELGGCARNDKWHEKELNSTTTEGCREVCRNYYYYANKHDVTHTKNDLKPSECLCTNRPDWKSKAITDTTLVNCPVQRRVKMTGQGFPHVVYDMPSAAFDAKKLDNVAMNGKDANMTGVNPLIGIQEIAHPATTPNESYFVAVHGFSVVLYKTSFNKFGRATNVEYIQHLRWDGLSANNNPDIVDKERWLYDWQQTTNEEFPMAPTEVLSLEKATSYSLINTFGSLSSGSFNESTIDMATGFPYVGGKWHQCLVVFHGSKGLLRRYTPEMSVFIITEHGLEYLRNAKAHSFFGAFHSKSQLTRNVVAAASRNVGRKSFLITASRDNTGVGIAGKLDIWKFEEKLVDLSPRSNHGRLEAEIVSYLALENIQSIAIGGFLNTNLLVLQNNGTVSLLKVYKMANKDDKAEPELIHEKHFNEKYTEVKYRRMSGKGAVILSGPKEVNSRKKNRITLQELTLKGVLLDLYWPGNRWDRKETSLNINALRSLTDAVTYGNLEERLLIFSSKAAKKIQIRPGGSPDAVHEFVDVDGAYSYVGLRCYQRSIGSSNGLCIASDNNYKMSVVTYKPLTLPEVDSKMFHETEWIALKMKIEGMIVHSTERFNAALEESNNYLGSGNSVTGQWTLANVKGVNALHVASGHSIESIKMSTNSANGTLSSPVAFKDALEVDLVVVNDSLVELSSKIDNVTSLFEKKTDLSVEVNLSNLEVGTLQSDKFYFGGYSDLHVGSLKSGGTVEATDSLLGNLYRKSINQRLQGTKTFAGKFYSKDLVTAVIEEDGTSAAPGNFLLNNGPQTISTSQAFGEANVDNLVLGSNSLLDKAGNASVVKEDLFIQPANLHGDFEFYNQIKTLNVTVEMASQASEYGLSNEFVSRILRKDETPVINGTLKINLVNTSALGSSVNVLDGVVNSISLKDLGEHALYTNCPDCEGRSENISGTITFEGNLTIEQDLEVTAMNTIAFENYVMKSAFVADGFTETAKKRFVGSVNADIVKADSYNNYDLSSIMTKSTNQTVDYMNFAEMVTFNELKCSKDPSTGVCPDVDGVNLLKTFKSDLYNLEKPWIRNMSMSPGKVLSSEIEINSLEIAADGKLYFQDKVNGMDVPITLAKVVQSSETNVALTGTKTFEKAVSAKGCTTNSIKKDLKSYETKDFASTASDRISGIKTFTKEVTFADMVFHRNALVNNVDFAKMLFCWIDIGQKNLPQGTTLKIDHFIEFTEVVTPALELARPSGAFTCPSSILSERLTNENINTVASSFIGSNANVGSVSAGINKMIDYRIKNEPVAKDKLAAKGRNLKEKLRAMLTAKYRMPAGSLDSIQSKLALLRLSCRNPHLNKLDPSRDVALLDAPNQLCIGGNCVVTFQKGFEAESLNISRIDISTANPVSTVFGYNIEQLNNDRVSLSKAQTLRGNYKFENLSIESGGEFVGKLFVHHAGEHISSLDYKDRFLEKNCMAGESESTKRQTFTQAKNVESLEAPSIAKSGTKAQLKVKNRNIDLKQLETSGRQLDQPNTFTNSLRFADEVELTKNTELTGNLDNVDVVALAKDVIVAGVSVSPNNQIFITGTNEPKIRFTGKKRFKEAPSVKNVNGQIIGGEVKPVLTHKLCSMGSKMQGQGNGTLLLTKKTTEDHCKRMCRRRKVCKFLTYNTDTCWLYSSIQTVLPGIGSVVTYSKECAVAIKLGKEFLAVDPTTKSLGVSNERDLWIVKGMLSTSLFNIYTGLAITTLNTEDSLLSKFDSGEVAQKLKFRELKKENKYEIMSGDSKKCLEWNRANATFSWGVKCKTGFTFYEGNGITADENVDDTLVTRVLTTDGTQTVTGVVDIVGDLKLEGSHTVTSQKIGSLDVTTVASHYNYASDTHTILEDYKLTDQLSASFVTAGTIGDRNFANFIDDTIDKLATEKQTFTGKKILKSTLTLTKDLTVRGQVCRKNLNTQYRNTAFKDANATYTASGTFKKDVVVHTQSTDPKLNVETNIFLTESVIKDNNAGVDLDLVDVFNNTILRDEAGPTNLAGSVVFKKNVNSFPALSVPGSLSGTNFSVSVPSDIVLISDKEIKTTINGETRKFASVTADKIELQGQLYGRAPVGYLNVLYKDGQQSITGAKDMSNVKSDRAVSVSGTINGIKMTNLVELKSGFSGAFDGNMTIENMTIEALEVKGNWDGVNFDGLYDNVLTLDGDQTIRAKLTIESPVKFEKEIVGNGNATDGEGSINNQKVTDIKMINGIYEEVAAVRTSAQAESCALCKYVVDLQESYLQAQYVDHYTDVASISFTMKPTDVRLFNWGPDKPWMVVIEDKDLKLHPVDEHAIRGAEVTLGLLDKESDQYNHMTIIPNTVDGCHVFIHYCHNKFELVHVSQSGHTTQASRIATTLPSNDLLSSSVAVGLDVYMLLWVEKDAGFYFTRIAKLVNETKSETLWDDTALIAASDINVNRRLDLILKEPINDELVFFFNTVTKEMKTNMGRVVHLYSNTRGEKQVWTTAVDIAGPDFTLLWIDWKLFLYSAGPFQLKIDNIDLSRQSVTPAAAGVDGKFSNLQRHLDYVGRSEVVSAVLDNEKLVDIHYSGTDGFYVTEVPINLEKKFVKSWSSAAYVSLGESRYLVTTVGEKDASLVLAKLASDVTRQQILCSEPHCSDH